MFSCVKLKTQELFLTLINFVLVWSLYLPIILKIGSSSNDSEYLYPWFGVIFKFGIFKKYSLNVSAIKSSKKYFFQLQSD